MLMHVLKKITKLKIKFKLCFLVILSIEIKGSYIRKNFLSIKLYKNLAKHIFCFSTPERLKPLNLTILISLENNIY